MTAAAKDPELEDGPEQEENDEAILDMEEYATPTRPTILFRTEEERKAGKEPTAYEMRVPEELGVADEQAFRAEVSEYGRLMQEPAALKKSERAKLKSRLDFLFGKVLIAPPEIRAHFNDKQKQAVVKAFQIALLREDALGIESAIRALPADLARGFGSTMAT